MKFKPVRANRDLTPLNPVLLITGDGMSLPDDLARFLEWQVNHDTMAIGRSIKRYPGTVLHWANVDSAECKHWADNLPGNPIRHTMGDWEWFDVDWGVENCEIHPDDIKWNGSTSLFAAYIGLEMGYDHIVLAGCPLDKQGHWYFDGLPENTGPEWEPISYDAWMEFAQDKRSDKVRSFSGFTADVLGTPDKGWISERV